MFEDWLAHVRAALPEIDDIRVVERDDDRHCYLMLRYGTGVENRQIDTLIGPYEGFAPSRQILLMKAVRRLPPLLRSHQQLLPTVDDNCVRTELRPHLPCLAHLLGKLVQACGGIRVLGDNS